MGEIIEKTIKFIAIYARVSTARQEEDGTIETQIAAVREFAAKSGYVIVKEYVDDGWSGDMLNRPMLDQLRQDAKAKLWDAVLIYDPSRLARRYSYQQLVIDELREGGTEPLFVTVPAPKNAEEKIMQGIHGIFAEYERAKITERFRLGKQRKVKEGNILLSEGPYGYRYVTKKEKVQGFLEVIAEEARIVKMIFEWVANDGLTIRTVVKRLQEKGIKPRKSKRGVWNTSTLTHLLRNKTYIGEAYYGRTYATVPENPFKTQKYRKIKKTSRKDRPEAEWVKIPVTAIIDKGLFSRAQAQLKANFELCQRNKKNEYLLAGKIWCVCGQRRSGEGPQHGKHLYYRCNDRVTKYPLSRTCFEAGINARIADGLVWKKLSELMTSPDLMTKEINRWKKDQKKKTQEVVGDTEAWKREITKLKKEEDRYNTAFGAGVFSIDQLKTYTTPVRERIASLEGQVAKTESRKIALNEATTPDAQEINDFSGKVIKTIADLNFALKQAIVRNAIETIKGTHAALKVSGHINLPEQLCQVQKYPSASSDFQTSASQPFSSYLPVTIF